MNVVELERALRQLRLGGIAHVLETRLRQAQAESMTVQVSGRRERFKLSCARDSISMSLHGEAGTTG